MRKYFLISIILLSLWVWSTDLTDILFFYFKYHYSPAIGNVASTGFFIILTVFFYLIFYKYSSKNRSSLKIDKKYFLELGTLVLCFLPILYLNYSRIMFPDADYDAQAYHFFLHRLNRLDNLRNFNLVGGAGGGTYFFTLSYKIFSFFREVFGYRLGTICNTFLIFLIYVSVYDLLKKWLLLYYPDKKVMVIIIAFSALFTVAADNTLFNLNSYKVDLIGLPLILEMIHILFFKKLNKDNKVYVTLVFFLLASITIAYKLTFLPYILIIGLGFFINNWSVLKREKWLILLSVVTLFFPAIYLIYNYTETQNPIFPFYNTLFKSPLYELANFKDARWGPRNLFELCFYNIISLLHKERNSEFQYFSFRLLSEYVIILVSVIVIIYNKFKLDNKKVKFIINLSLIAILCNYMLLYTTGYYRYGVLIEVLFGAVLVLWAFLLFFSKKWIWFGMLFIFAGIQSIEVFKTIFVKGTNLSWYNYKELKITNNGEVFKGEFKRILHDRQTGVDADIANLKIDAFLSSDCNGFGKLLAPDIPIYNTLSFGKRQAIVDSFQLNIIDTLSQKHNFYVIVAKDNLFEKVKELNDRKYLIDSIVDIYPSFTPLNAPLYLMKIKHYNNQFKIINKTSALRVDSNGVSKRFYNESIHKFKTFIIEDPYTYNWPFRQNSAKFSVNDILYNLDTRNNKNKIVTIQETNKLDFKNNQDLQYFIIVQTLQYNEVK